MWGKSGIKGDAPDRQGREMIDDNENGNGNGATDEPRPKIKRGTNPEFLANQWKPGQSGNPKGRPKSATISEEIRAALEEFIKHGGQNLSTREAIAQVIIKQALAGRYTFVKEIMDRTEGKVAEKMEMSGPGGEKLFDVIDLAAQDDRETFYKLLQRGPINGGD